MEAKSAVDMLKTLNDTLTNGLKQLEAAALKRPQMNKAHSVTRSETVDVYIRVVFLKIGDIDTIKEQYTADLFIQARWREPSLDGQGKNEDGDVPASGHFWNPQLHVDNALGDLKDDVWYHVAYNDVGEATMYERRRAKGTFFERMELMEYPFDNQDLTVTMSTTRGEKELTLQADQSEISTVNIQSFLDSQEWHLHKHINSWTRVTTNVYHNTKHKHPAVSISCKASRKARFFLWNIILIMIMIGSLSFTTFAVNVNLVQNRIQLSFILILASVTFKFIVTNSLPRVNYLTWVDKYIISSMAILCLVCVWHAIMAKVFNTYGEDTAKKADWIGLIVIGSFYFILNVGFFLFTQCIVRHKHIQYTRKDLEQKEKLKLMSEQRHEEILSSKRSQVAPLIDAI